MAIGNIKICQANIGNMITQQIDHGFYYILFVLQFCVTITTTTFWFRQKLQSWDLILYMIYANLWLYVDIKE